MLKEIHLFPITLHSIHFCHPGIYFDSLYSGLAAIKEPGISLHSHIGSVEVVAGRLEQFGIPKRSILRDLGGELNLEEFTSAWIGYSVPKVFDENSVNNKRHNKRGLNQKLMAFAYF